jgi:hypothetical protein
MKTTRLFVAIIGAALLLFAATAYAEDSAVTLAGFEGKVLVKIAPSADWTDAAIDQKLKAKDAIKTGDDGKALLEFSDKSSVALKKNTEVTIEELSWTDAARKADLNVPSGELRAIINKVGGPSQFRVKTPTAICGARGTVFYVMVTAGETRVFVTDGAVDFSNANGENTYVVVENMQAISDATGVSEPTELTGAEREQALAGWDGVIAEPYTEPGGDEGGNDQGDNNNFQSDETAERPAEQPASPI